MLLKLQVIVIYLAFNKLIFQVFFVLRKKDRHISFLHVYHHFGMVLITWIGVKFIAGGHSAWLGLANAIVHCLLYSYYLLTAYDSKYGQLIWLKKLITQAQLVNILLIIYICIYDIYLMRQQVQCPILRPMIYKKGLINWVVKINIFKNNLIYVYLKNKIMNICLMQC